jgi:uncharacterized damage-inducible protein DinB
MSNLPHPRYHPQMPQSNPLKILLAHNHWATTQLLDACAALPPAHFHQKFEIGPGSLHDTLTHIIGATRAWTETLAQSDPRPRLETDGQQRTPQQLRTLLDQANQDLEAESHRRPLEETVTRRTRDGRTIHLTRAAVLMQVTTHAMHHRAQCLNMLRHLGVTPLPPSSVTEWTWLGDTQ